MIRPHLPKTDKILDIDEWWVCEWGSNRPFTATSQEKPCFLGLVSGHPDIPGPIYVKTAPIEKMVGPGIFQTHNGNRYRAGEPDSVYASHFPRCCEDLIAMFGPSAETQKEQE